MNKPSSFLVLQSSTAHLKPEDTQGLLEKVNIFVKNSGGHFSLSITPMAIECRYVHPSGVSSSIGDSFAAPSDAVSEVMSRAQAILNEIEQHTLKVVEKQAEFLRENHPEKIN